MAALVGTGCTHCPRQDFLQHLKALQLSSAVPFPWLPAVLSPIRHHPDVLGSHTSEKFMELHEAYSLMIGKATGKSGSSSQDGWDFHDWYWSFAKNHRRRSADGASHEPQRPAGSSHIRHQLHHMKARASRRSVKGKTHEPAHDTHMLRESGVHPAWAASVQSTDGAEFGSFGGSADGETAAESDSGGVGYGHVGSVSGSDDSDSFDDAEASPFSDNNYSHRPPSVGCNHLNGQLSGLKRRAILKQRQA